MSSSASLTGAPVWLFAVLALLAVAQLSFEIYALVDMLRRPADQLTLGGRKWLWAIIILGVSWIGAIVYLLAGRKPVVGPDVHGARSEGYAAQDAADVLYGSKSDDLPR